MRIAFGHQARVGKDTACSFLQQKYGGKILHFSDALYEILFHTQQVCGFEKKKDPEFLQAIGTWARKQNPNTWVDLLTKQINYYNNYFVGDLRYPNEARALKDLGFICVKIVRTDRPIDRDRQHESEISLSDWDGWDCVIENNGSEEDFLKQVDKCITGLVL